MKGFNAMLAGGAFVICTALAGTTIVPALAANPPAPSDLNSDLHAAQAGEHATASDSDAAAEQDVDNGAVDNRDVQEEHQEGAQGTDTANDVSSSDEKGQTGSQATDASGDGPGGADQNTPKP